MADAKQDLILYPPRLASGIQPARAVHLGHFFGALKQHIDLHHQYPGRAFFLIADYHVLTRGKDPKLVKEGTLELATTYLALGLDPNKATLYRQSDVPECTELAWILSCLVPTADLMRLPVYRTAKEAGKQATVGLLSYPILMAADIFSLRATVVPVGSDQVLNVERVRDMALRFNEMYDTDLFPIPELSISFSEVVPGTDGRKMSDSHSNAIFLFERFDQLRQRVANIVTDSKSRYEPKDPDKCKVFALYSLVAPADRVETMRFRYKEGGIGYDDAKRELTLAIQEYFSIYQERYDRLKRDPYFVEDLLREGFRRAGEEARRTLDEVRSLVGLASS